jgi:two-component system, LytTR family, response regulator
MKMIKCAIIEDEPTGAKMLVSLLSSYEPQFTVIAFAKTMTEAEQIFKDKNIDLIFADIELSDGSIFEVLNRIELEPGKQIIFTTAYEEFGAKAFNYPALHYLLKPIHPEEFKKALNRYKTIALKETEIEPQEKVNTPQFEIEKFTLPTQNGILFIEFDDVIRIQSSNKYSIVFTIDRKQHIVSKPLTKFEELLAKKGFIRVHDSHIINVHHLKEYLKGKGGQIVMSDDSHVPISIRRKEALSAFLKYPL